MSAVLVVEDDADSREWLVKALGRSGHDVFAVSNGRDALAEVGLSRPDVIILDILMPGMDGIDFLEVLRSYLGWQQLPVIVITALSEGPQLERARRRGVQRVFLKSDFLLSELLESVQQLAAQQPLAASSSGASLRV
jgi:CheY-like chemotaxis protein